MPAGQALCGAQPGGRAADINFGAIYENAVAQELKCHGFDLLYFKNRAVGELDFVVQSCNRMVPIEVKSGVRAEMRPS